METIPRCYTCHKELQNLNYENYCSMACALQDKDNIFEHGDDHYSVSSLIIRIGSRNGYGSTANRIMYQYTYGKVNGLSRIKRTCRSGQCCNPEHLQEYKHFSEICLEEENNKIVEELTFANMGIDKDRQKFELIKQRQSLLERARNLVEEIKISPNLEDKQMANQIIEPTIKKYCKHCFKSIETSKLENDYCDPRCLFRAYITEFDGGNPAGNCFEAKDPSIVWKENNKTLSLREIALFIKYGDDAKDNGEACAVNPGKCINPNHLEAPSLLTEFKAYLFQIAENDRTKWANDYKKLLYEYQQDAIIEGDHEAANKYTKKLQEFYNCMNSIKE